jgi:hypothetical protein
MSVIGLEIVTARLVTSVLTASDQAQDDAAQLRRAWSRVQRKVQQKQASPKP